MSRALVATLIAGLFASLALAASDGDPLPYKREVNVVYAEVHGTGLLADIFIPTGKANGLGIIDVVSGAWFSDRGKLHDHELAQVYNIFCRHGYTVFAIRPGSLTKYAGDEMLKNVKTGIRYVKSKAADYGVDPNRLGLMGASAGGHLALLAAVTAEDGDPSAKDPLLHYDTRVKAVSVFFPPTDFLDWDGKMPNLKGAIGQLMFLGGTEGHTPEEIEAKAKELSPRHQIKEGAKLPPFLLFHGDADPLVPLQQSQSFVDAVKAAGGQAELIVKPGGGHPWATLPEEVAVMADWFDKQL